MELCERKQEQVKNRAKTTTSSMYNHARASERVHVTFKYMPVAPVAYQVILEPGISQFREFEPRRVHTRMDSLGFFLVLKL